MADDLKKLLQQALKFTQGGKPDKAIETYQAILKLTPKDTRILNNLGDLYLRKKMINEAANVFSTLAQLYEEDGYTLRAIAICQKVLKVEPEAMAVKGKIAELYARQGLTVEARNQYLDLANYYDKEGKVKEALEIFRKLADLDPTNLSVRTKLGNTFFKEGIVDKAAIEWTKAAEGYLKKEENDKARELLEKAIEAAPADARSRVVLGGEEVRANNDDRAIELLLPLVEAGSSDLEALKIYAAALLKKQRYEEAAEILKKIHNKEPDSLPVKENLGLALVKSGNYKEGAAILLKIINIHIKENRWNKAEKLALELRSADNQDAQVLQKLVDVYVNSGDKAALLETYKNLAELYEQRGLKKNVLGIFEKLMEAEPDNDQWQNKVAEYGGIPEVEPEIEVPLQAMEVEKGQIEEQSGEGGVEEDLGLLIATEEEKEAEEIFIDVDEEIEAIESPMALIESCLKKGMFSEAETRLQQVIGAQPTIENLSMLKELYRMQDDTGKYVQAAFDVAAFLESQGKGQEAITQYQDILRVDKGNARARDALADLTVYAAAATDIEVEENKEREVVEYDDAIEISEVDLESVDELDLEKLVGDISDKETVTETPAAPVSVEGDQSPLGEAPPEKVASGMRMDEADELLAEADFYYQQGLIEDAERVYRDILSSDPGRMDVAARLAELSAKEETIFPEKEELVIDGQDLEEFGRSLEADLPEAKKEIRFSVAPEVSPEEDISRTEDFGDFLADLKKELEEPKTPSSSSLLEEESLQEIFQEFKQGVKENLSDEDYDTHYNLGIAYKEMGLIDEAMSEFELAIKSKDHYVDAISMIALCYKDQNQLDKAAEALHKALANLDPEDQNRKGLRWELAVIYEKMGEREKAVDTYLSVYEMDDSYRGIQDKLKNLGVFNGIGTSTGASEDKAGESPPDNSEGKKSKRVSYI